jgi:hypothetical protein
MGEFQDMTGTKVKSPITAVVGNSIHLKAIPGIKEQLPTISAAPESVAKVSHIDERTKANFTTFHLDAVAIGKASLQGTDSKKATIAGPIQVVVEAKVALPAAATNDGLFVRLFLAEAASPEDPLYSLKDAKTAMTWMRVVVQNRLAKPSAVWSSAGAKSFTDVIKAKGQFEGFSTYPTIAHKVQNVIDRAVSIANDGDDPRRSKYRDFVGAALEVAALKTVTDPSSKGLYWWQTAGSGKPSPTVTVYMTKSGNTFYTP